MKRELAQKHFDVAFASIQNAIAMLQQISGSEVSIELQLTTDRMAEQLLSVFTVDSRLDKSLHDLVQVAINNLPE